MRLQHPWAQQLFEALDDLQPADFANEVQRQTESGAPVRSEASLTQLEATLERLEKLWGHLPDEKYQAERERLEALRAELTAVELDREPPILLDDILAAWNGADEQGRRELLGACSTNST